MKILIKYGNGSEETCHTDHETEEAFVNEKFGSAYQAFLDGGGEIGQAPETEPAESDDDETN